MSIRKRLDLAVEDGELSSDVSTTDLAKFYTVVIQGLAQHGGTRKDLLRVVAVAMEQWPDRSSPANSRLMPAGAVYFAIPGPFELEACRPDGLAETLP
jgi:hypothetical protein